MRILIWQELAVCKAQKTPVVQLVVQGTPDDIGNMVAFLVSPGGQWVTGAIMVVDGGSWLTRM